MIVFLLSVVLNPAKAAAALYSLVWQCPRCCCNLVTDVTSCVLSSSVCVDVLVVFLVVTHAKLYQCWFSYCV